MNKGKVVFYYPTIIDVWEHVWLPFPYLYLSPFVERAGYTVRIIDARVEQNWKDALLHEIGDATAFAITGMSGPDLANAVEACKIVRERRPDLPIVWGGHHARHLPEMILQEGIGDYVCTGAAEYIFVELLDCIGKKVEPNHIQGLVYQKNGDLKGDKTPTIVDFNYDIFPAYHLIDIEKYRSPKNIGTCFASRGCPFKCSFCSSGDFDNSTRTIDQVRRELHFIAHDLGFGSIFFRDPTFFLSKKRVLKIAEILTDLDLKWKAQARANSLLEYSDDEMNYLMESGLKSIIFGIESGSQVVLANMDKIITPEDTLKSAKLSEKYGFEFYASMMFATPGETIEDLKETISLIKKIKEITPYATIQNSVYIPLPGTLMYDMCLDRGFQPPETMAEWARRDITSNFENRDDITWIEPSLLKEYIRIYDYEFPNYRHVPDREKDGEYVSPLN